MDTNSLMLVIALPIPKNRDANEPEEFVIGVPSVKRERGQIHNVEAPKEIGITQEKEVRC